MPKLGYRQTEEHKGKIRKRMMGNTYGTSGLIDLTGQRFGRWTVIKRSNNKNTNPRWLCKCDCGTERVVIGESLRTGVSRSCGCLKNELTGKRCSYAPGLASKRRAMVNYKGNAKKKNLEFNLTEEQFFRLTQKDCYYCGAEPNNIINNRYNNGNYIYNGLDRMDNTKGYTIDNVVPCCGICNHAKNNMTSEKFKDWVRKLYSNLSRKE